MSVSITINSAIYGGNDELCLARDITQSVQARINSGDTQVTFDNTSFGDPARRSGKGFAVVATIDDAQYVYAGKEGDTIDFSKFPVNHEGPSNLRVSALEVIYDSSNSLFTECSIALENLASEDFPNNTYPSSWVWLDFYLVASNTPMQATSAFTQVGELPVSITFPIGYKEKQNFHLTGYEHVDMVKFLSRVPRLVESGDYYLYAQVRNEQGTLNTSIGCFSASAFSYSV